MNIKFRMMGYDMKSCLLTGLFYMMVGCSYDHGISINPVESANCTLKDSTISFSRHIMPIFNTYCNQADCHSGSSPQGNLNLEASVAYVQITSKGKGYVDTLNPKNGVLYSSMVSVSAPMPPTGKLGNCTLQIIENWMRQGAKNN